MIAVAVLPGPPIFDATSFAVYTPETKYVCVKLWRDDWLQSPKSQLHALGEPLDVSMKLTINGADPLVGEAEKLVTGGAVSPAVSQA